MIIQAVKQGQDLVADRLLERGKDRALQITAGDRDRLAAHVA